MRKILTSLVIFGVFCGAFLWWLSRPIPVAADLLTGLTGDATRGELVFNAGGCASCHAAPTAKDDEKLVLSGGYRIVSPFGTFLAPNISPSQQGIGGWSAQDLANALIAGVSPDGQHYYPALPYTTYQRMQPQDVVDLKTFMDTLPSSDVASLPNELTFPFTLRRGLGLWKQLNMNPEWILKDVPTPDLQRGRYLVEALGHCAECHTPRDITGGLDRSQWMAGAANPSGEGKIPGISPATLDWSAKDIAYFLETGLTPDYDSAGGQMTKVIYNTSKLPPEDRAAIAAYLKALP